MATFSSFRAKIYLHFAIYFVSAEVQNKLVVFIKCRGLGLQKRIIELLRQNQGPRLRHLKVEQVFKIMHNF